MKKGRKNHRLGEMLGERQLEELPPSLSELTDKRPRKGPAGPLRPSLPFAPPPDGALSSVPHSNGRFAVHRLDRARDHICSSCGKQFNRAQVITKRRTGEVFCALCVPSAAAG
jgi:hypothetical protein